MENKIIVDCTFIDYGGAVTNAITQDEVIEAITDLLAELADGEGLGVVSSVKPKEQ